MDNVPSSAIMAIIGIVAACFIGTFIFASTRMQKESGNLVASKIEGVSSNISEADIAMYDGKTVTGADVKSAIKLFKNELLQIEVEGHGVYNYLIRSMSWSRPVWTGSGWGSEEGWSYDPQKIVDGEPDTSKNEIKSDNGRFAKVSSNKSDPSYIDPTEYYVGSIERNHDNGEVMYLTFKKKNKA